jgi:hypothetical protein
MTTMFYNEPTEYVISKPYADDYCFWKAWCLGTQRKFNNELDGWKWIARELDEKLPSHLEAIKEIKACEDDRTGDCFPTY